MTITAIIVTIVNVLQIGISKVDSACGVVQGQAIGPVELCVDNHLSNRSIHVGLLDPGVLTPVGPEHKVGAEKNYSVI